MTASRQALAAKEFHLMQEIARGPEKTQRELSQSTGFSLGMTNLLIRRLTRKGFIKVTQLDWKRTRYILTLKGAMEKARKSYDYTLYTIRILRQLQENISVALRREFESGHRDFTVVAQDEILEFIQQTVESMGLAGADFTYVNSFQELRQDAALVLTAVPENAPENGRRFITLVDFHDVDFRLE